MKLFMILAQACDLGRRHRKARVGDRGYWQETESWESRAQSLAPWAFTEELLER